MYHAVRWPSVLGDDDALMLTRDTVDELGEPIFPRPQCLSRHGYNCPRPARSSNVVRVRRRA
jgi:hypothetical protein